MDTLIEVVTFKQPSGVIIQLRRLKADYDGYERLVDGQPQEWGTCDGNYWSKRQMTEWKFFEESIGSEEL